MHLMAWSDHFLTGIHPVDQQHRALVTMINDAAPHLVSDSDDAQQTVGPLLDKLIQYAATHFKFEEDLMQEVRVDSGYQAQHQHTHQAFVEEVLLMRAQYDRGEHLSGHDLLQFLTSWLTFHILSEDKQMARQVLAIRQGESAAHAFAALDAPNNAPQAVYNAALIDLFSLLTERNRTLSVAYAETRAAKRALETLNQELELRVTARTQELADTNAALLGERLALMDSMSKLEQTQNQLLQSEKMAAVGQLAAGVAHEINNPIGFVSSNLGSLSGYVNQLLKLLHAYETVRPVLPAEQRAAVERQAAAIDLAFIRDDVVDLLQESGTGLERVKRIVNDLRMYAQGDNAVWEPSDLNQLLELSLHELHAEITPKADVVLQLTPLPSIQGVRYQLNRLFINLLRNAAQAIDGHGTITVRSGTEARLVWVEVCDTGCGMSEDTLRRIFEPFFTTHAVGQGTGLGLTLAWDIVKRHCGELTVRSTPGQGTTFRIAFALPTT